MSRADVEADIRGTLGTVPSFFEQVPDDLIESEWQIFKSLQLGETAIPNKYKELIGIAIAGATRCRYCAYFHTTAARLFGATEEEIAELDGLSDEARGARGKLIFSAKECAYKCQYAVSSTFYGFMGMRVDIDAEPGATAGAFRATFLRDAGPFRPGDVIGGRFARRGGYVMTGAILR